MDEHGYLSLLDDEFADVESPKTNLVKPAFSGLAKSEAKAEQIAIHQQSQEIMRGFLELPSQTGTRMQQDETQEEYAKRAVKEISQMFDKRSPGTVFTDRSQPKMFLNLMDMAKRVLEPPTDYENIPERAMYYEIKNRKRLDKQHPFPQKKKMKTH